MEFRIKIETRGDESNYIPQGKKRNGEWRTYRAMVGEYGLFLASLEGMAYFFGKKVSFSTEEEAVKFLQSEKEDFENMEKKKNSKNSTTQITYKTL